MSAITVDVSDFVAVSVAFTPESVPFENFGTLMIMGDSGVIDVVERARRYSNILQVSADFQTNAPEYLAATLFFEQSPQPALVDIGRWAATATRGLLHGAHLTPTQQLLTNFTSVSNGSFAISINGVAHDVTALNFSAALNLNGVASIIQAGLVAAFTTGVTCTWDSSFGHFDIKSNTNGTSSTVGFASTIGTLGGSTDVSTRLGLTAASGASPPVVGIAAETPLQAVQALSGLSSDWYGLMDATTLALTPTDYIDIAAFIQASSRSRIFGTTITNSACLDPTQTSDLASVLLSLNNRRIFWMYSGFNNYAVATMFGRGFTVDFAANNSTLTLAYKQTPGLQGENLNETQFATLIAKGGNVNIKVNNGAIMLWNGQMTNGYWFDEVQGVDWLQNQIQTDVFNLLYTITTKVPQTDAGSDLIANAIVQGCEAGVNNGLMAPGQWNAAGFGMLKQGGTLTKGYYCYYPPVATQAESDRQLRKSVPFQVAVKLAGAVQTVDVLLNINP